MFHVDKENRRTYTGEFTKAFVNNGQVGSIVFTKDKGSIMFFNLRGLEEFLTEANELHKLLKQEQS